MSDIKSQVLLSTYNENYRAAGTISRFFIAGGTTDQLNTLKFSIRNPNAITINPTVIESLERVQGGYVKIGFGAGLLNLVVNTTIPAYRLEKGQKVYEGDIRQTEGWLWLGAFYSFINDNCEYPFAMMFHGTPSQFLEIPSYNEASAEYSTYILKGSASFPSYSMNADNPRLINFSFNFSGIPMQQPNKDTSAFKLAADGISQETIAQFIAETTTYKNEFTGLL